jgi:hypothetical protein
MSNKNDEITQQLSLYEALTKKWGDVLDFEGPGCPQIKDPWIKKSTAMVIENTVRESRGISDMTNMHGLLTEAPIPANFMGASSSTAGAGGIDTFDPVLVSLVRRTMPNLIANEIAGVQPMTGPVGLIFAMRARYSNQTGGETFYNEVNTHHTTIAAGANTLGDKHVGSLPGNTTQTSNLASTGLYNYADAMSRAQGEALGTDSNSAYPEMAFTIEKMSVTAGTRALQAAYTLELAQDLKAVHGLDAESELSKILSTEIMAEINREIVRTINITAKQGAQTDTTTAGIFDMDTDSGGRWLGEKFKGFMFYLERESGVIARETRRGKGNILVCSSDIAAALQMAGVINYNPAVEKMNNLHHDDTGMTFAGIANGRIKVYIDPYAAGGQYATMGYKGSSFVDAGLFYCPYVPLTLVRAVDPESYHPKFAFKTRYGMVANPYAQGLTKGDGALVKDSNVYYRRTIVTNLM